MFFFYFQSSDIQKTIYFQSDSVTLIGVVLTKSSQLKISSIVDLQPGLLQQSSESDFAIFSSNVYITLPYQAKENKRRYFAMWI